MKDENNVPYCISVNVFATQNCQTVDKLFFKLKFLAKKFSETKF